jgi:protein-S-isoprenylcysteine O-methyltransferase Ste14
MPSLELRIPPVVLVAIFALCNAAFAWALPALAWKLPGRAALAVVLALTGALIAAAGVIEFRRAHTTVNPLVPESSSSLVASGVYRASRNPMYLGFLLALAGWAVWLSHLSAGVLLPLFVAYMNRYQIAPEERALHARFGPAFTDYAASVRRWI